MNTNLIVSEPYVMLGKPGVAGTRITVELILEKLEAGESHQQILEAHPGLKEESIQAAIQFSDEQDMAAWARAGAKALDHWAKDNPF